MTTPGEPLTWLLSTIAKDHGDTCVLFPFGEAAVYGRVVVNGRGMGAHRAALILSGSFPPPPPRDHALHSCDTPRCVNLRHLTWGTNAQNRQQSVDRGRIQWGAARHNARLTADDVQAIRLSAEQGAVLATQYGVGRTTIYAIRNGQNWRNLPWPNRLRTPR